MLMYRLWLKSDTIYPFKYECLSTLRLYSCVSEAHALKLFSSAFDSDIFFM